MFARRLHQPGDRVARGVLRTFKQPDRVVVDDEERDVVHGVAAGHGACDEVRHDVAAAGLRQVAGLVGELGQRVAGDAAGGEGQGRLLGRAQRLGAVRALVGQRTTVQAHAAAKAARAALDQGLQQRVLASCSRRSGAG